MNQKPRSQLKGGILRSGTNAFVPTSAEGLPEPLLKLAKDEKEMARNLEALELLRSICFENSKGPMRKDIVVIKK